MAGAAEQFRSRTRAKNLRRVGIEGHDNRRTVVLGGVFLGCTNDFLMPEVDAVENTNGKGEGAGKGGEGVDGAKNLHAWLEKQPYQVAMQSAR